MECDLCHKEFTPPDGTLPAAVLGRYFCCDEHEQKYLKLYAKWLEAAYEGKTYEQNGSVQR